MYCVFLDLDETIIQGKSMLQALEYYYGNANEKYADFMLNIKNYSQSNNASREQLNQYFYSKFSSFNVESMKEKCEEWFCEKGKGTLNARVIDEIKFHQENNACVVIVSGSFFECVKPIAEHLKIEKIICNELEISNGLYTGKLLNQPIIGQEKANRITQLVESEKLSFMGSHAYGDHISDLPMMMLAENPVVVGNDPQLVSYGQFNGWKRLN